MDVHVHGKPRHHYRLNGCQHAKDDGLQFLSVEEKECIQFFEETIGSLEEGFDDTTGLTSRRTTSVGGLQNLSSPVHAAKVSPSLMENDIIDLVCAPTSFTMPDFQNLAVTPESHYETFPKKVPIDGVPSSITSPDVHEENDHQPPPGSVPTPVVIASKIAEHRGNGAITPAKLLGHRRSLETKPDSPLSTKTPHLPSKISITQGKRDSSPHSLATAAVNIQERRSQMFANLPAGSHPLERGEPACMHSFPASSVSFKDKEPERSRMEALSKLGLIEGKTSNLTASSLIAKRSSSPTSSNSSAYKGCSSPSSLLSNLNKGSSNFTSSNSSAYKVSRSPTLPIGSLNKGGSSPTSFISSFNKESSSPTSPFAAFNIGSPTSVFSSPFKGRNSPNLHISLNKESSSPTLPIGSYNKGSNSPTSPISSPYKGSSSSIWAKNSANKVSANAQAHLSNNRNTSSNTTGSSYDPKPRSEIFSRSFNYYGGKSAAISPISKGSPAPDNRERRSSIPPSSAEVKQTDFNSYGGKTVVLNPTKSGKAESIPSTSSNTSEPSETHFNSYGGRSRVMNPLVNTDIPDGADCAQSHLPTHAVTPTTHDNDARLRQPSDQTSKAPTPLQSDPIYQALSRTRPTTLPSQTPSLQCPTGSFRPRPDPVPPEILSKPVPSFRTQGITVQFSGKGTTGEARRDALRRLGLLNNTS